MRSQPGRAASLLVLAVALLLAVGVYYLKRQTVSHPGAGTVTVSTPENQQDPTETYRRLCAAKKLVTEGRHADAVAAFEEIVRAGGNSSYRWDAEIQAAVSIAYLNRFDEALSRLERIIRECPLDDESAFAHLARADVLSRSGKHDQALVQFEEIVASRGVDRPWIAEEALLGILRVAQRGDQRGLERATLARLIFDFPGQEDSRRRAAEAETKKLDQKAAELQRQAVEAWSGRRIDRIDPGTTLKAAEGPWLVTGPVTVAATDTLTIEPGSQLRFVSAGSLQVEGRLVAAGTAERPISLLPLRDEPGRDYWLGLEVRGSTAVAELTHCRIVAGDPGVKVSGGRATLKTCTLQSSGQAAILGEENAHIALDDCTLAGSYRCGVECRSGASLQLAGSRFSGIRTVGVYLFRASSNCSLIGTRWEKCGGDGIWLRATDGATIDDCQVTGSGGNGITASEQSSLRVGGSRLAANARAGLHLVDRSNVTLEACTISDNAGGGILGEARCTGEIKGSRIEANRFAGLRLSLDCTPSVTRNAIVRNQGPGVLLLNSAPKELRYNEIAGNTEAGLRNVGAVRVDAAENWWGSADEAEVARRIEDHADKPEWGEVNYRPWLKEAPQGK